MQGYMLLIAHPVQFRKQICKGDIPALSILPEINVYHFPPESNIPFELSLQSITAFQK